jgi:hypothetical protein
MSGCDGHSVFNIYLVISGRPGHGGIVDLNTYFVGSGTGHGAGDTVLLKSGHVFALGLQPQFERGLSHTLQGHLHAGLGISHVSHLHSHFFFGFLHVLQ